MTEERIKQAAETIHSANKLTITEGILHTIAAGARKGGIEAMRDAVISNENPILLLWDDQCTEVEAIAERLKE